jgi:hypothetical protein
MKMGGLDKGISCDFDTDFKGLPVKNRVKLIKTAQNLLEVQKTSRANKVLFADAPAPPIEAEKGLG